MPVHPTPPDQRRVEPVNVVRGEHEDPLRATGRPQPVDEAEQPRQRHFAFVIILVGQLYRHQVVVVFLFGCLLALALGGEFDLDGVDVLDNDDGSVRRIKEELPQLGVVLDGC